MTTFYVRAGSRDTSVTIDETTDYVAEGGEKVVYAKGRTAYCVYHDPLNAIDEAKIRELASVGSDGFIAPKALLLDSKKNRIGETMPFLKNTFVLCQLFSNGFRKKKKLTHKHDLAILDQMQEIMLAAHRSNVILVDANDMNWLVSKKFDKVSLIDTNSAQTESFPAQAIKPAIFDPKCSKVFTPETDYYSLAVVFSWLWSGIHPFTAMMDGVKDDMSWRMERGISIFDSRAKLNTATRDPHAMPKGVLQWVRSCLESDKRPAPPTDYNRSIAIVPVRPKTTKTAGVTLETIRIAKGDIDLVAGPWMVANGSLFKDGTKVPVDPGVIAWDDRSRGGFVVTDCDMTSLTSGSRGSLPCSGDETLFAVGSDLFVVKKRGLFRVDIRDINGGLKHSYTEISKLANLPNATLVGDGCVVQDLVGRKVIVTPDGQKIVDLPKTRVLAARYQGGVIGLTTINRKKVTNRVYLLNGDWSDSWSAQTADMPNFCVTDKGILVENRNGKLLARRLSGPESEKKANIDPTLRLYSRGPMVLGTLDNRLVQVKMS